MPFPPAHNRVIFSGVLAQQTAGGTDIFSFTLADASGLAPGVLANDISAAAQAMWTSNGVDIYQSASLTQIAVEAVGADGKVESSYALEVGPIQGLNTLGAPTFCCNALTLQTTSLRPNGRKIWGRIYPPAICPDVIGSTTTNADASSYANSWSLAISSLKHAGMMPVVASTAGTGELAPIASVSCDTIVDTQLRRKNAVTGSRSYAHPLT